MMKYLFSLIIISSLLAAVLLVSGSPLEQEAGFVAVKDKESCTTLYESFKGEKAKNAKDFNVAGFELYKKKSYEEAADFFRCALAHNENFELAHYNLSCMLSVLHGQNKEIDAGELFYHLTRFLELNAAGLAKVLRDVDLDPVRGMARYGYIINRFFPDSKVIGELKAHERWRWTEPETLNWQYVFGNDRYCYYGSTIEFLEEHLKDRDFIGESVVCGTYGVVDNVIYFDDGNVRAVDLVFLGKGKMDIYNAKGYAGKLAGSYAVRNTTYGELYKAEGSAKDDNRAILGRLNAIIKAASIKRKIHERILYRFFIYDDEFEDLPDDIADAVVRTRKENGDLVLGDKMYGRRLYLTRKRLHEDYMVLVDSGATGNGTMRIINGKTHGPLGEVFASRIIIIDDFKNDHFVIEALVDEGADKCQLFRYVFKSGRYWKVVP